MLIPAAELQTLIRTLWQEVQFPRAIRAQKIFVPSLIFLRTEWPEFWRPYKRSRGLTTFNAGLCDLITAAAAVEFHWAVNRRAAREHWGEVAGGMIEVRCSIPPDRPLHGAIGLHSTILVPAHSGGPDWELYFWEPQENEKQPSTYTLAGEALENGVDLLDAFI